MGVVTCPICNDKFNSEKDWTRDIQSLIRHIEGTHHNPILRVQRWCSFCQNTSVRVSNHPCFGGISPVNPDGIVPDLKYKCHRCPYSCDSLQGITSHRQKHLADDRRNRVNAIRHPPSAPAPALSMPTLDQLLNDSMGNSAPSSSIPATGNFDAHNGDDAGIHIDDGEPDGEGDNPLGGRIPNPDAASPPAELAAEFASLRRNFRSSDFDFELLLLPPSKKNSS